MYRKRVYIIGGGTFSYVRSHFDVCARAFGTTARQLMTLCQQQMPEMESIMSLTAMATGGKRTLTTSSIQAIQEWEREAEGLRNNMVTNDDVARFLYFVNHDMKAKVVFMSAAMCDFHGTIVENLPGQLMLRTQSGKYEPRLSSRREEVMIITPAAKVIGLLRNGGTYTTLEKEPLQFQPRKDLFLIGFKTTSGETADEQYVRALNLCKTASCNLVLANDIVTHLNMVVTPEEARYHASEHREHVLDNLVQMTKLRSQLTFTRSTVVAGDPIPWESDEVPAALREVVNYCIAQDAYKPFNGSTVGHFACKKSDTVFLTSKRKTNFNDLPKNGLVKIETDGPDTVIAYGSKPSVGGQSQRIVFTEHPEYDCIVHAHVPIKPGSKVPVVSQREFECGSHECGRNTSNGLRRFGNLSAVMLDQHGPNIVFHHSINPQEVIRFINENFDLSQKTGGPVSVQTEPVAHVNV